MQNATVVRPLASHFGERSAVRRSTRGGAELAISYSFAQCGGDPVGAHDASPDELHRLPHLSHHLRLDARIGFAVGGGDQILGDERNDGKD